EVDDNVNRTRPRRRIRLKREGDAARNKLARRRADERDWSGRFRPGRPRATRSRYAGLSVERRRKLSSGCCHGDGVLPADGYPCHTWIAVAGNLSDREIRAAAG